MKKNGYTMIETLITIIISSMILGVVVSFVVLGYRTQTFSYEQSRAIDEARKGVETMLKEIRESRTAENGSYIIAEANDFQFIFYSDIDKDERIERVRYFLETDSTSQEYTDTKECVTFDDGGSCEVNFADFLSGTFESAEVKVTVEGDFSSWHERASIYADGNYLGRICESGAGCSDCAGDWQGEATYDVSSEASDNQITFRADASGTVNDVCNWINPNHAMKAKFEFKWTETVSPQGDGGVLKKGVIEPVGWPPSYPLDQEEVDILSLYVRNSPPIFTYFDGEGNQLIEMPARKKDTKIMKIYLVINVDPNRAPDDFILESRVQVRNLKNNL